MSIAENSDNNSKDMIQLLSSEIYNKIYNKVKDELSKIGEN
jgi:hypothetical protein